MKAVFWAGVGTLFPFLMTITGAALVFLLTLAIGLVGLFYKQKIMEHLHRSSKE